MGAETSQDLGLSDRGVGVQAAGFALVGCASLAILHLFSDGNYWLYQWFETAVTRLYWAFVVPLAALFDWGRIMFAKGKAIREAKKAEIVAKFKAEGMQQGMQRGMQQGAEQERRRVEAVLSRHGVKLSKEATDELFGE